MVFRKQPPSLASIKRNRNVININKEHDESLTRLEHVAIFISSHVGTPSFFFAIITWTVVWLLWNTFAPVNLRFDPVPACVAWLFISNMIQISLMPMIMVAQNLQSRHAEKRAERAFEVDQRTEQVAEAILQHLEYQTSILLSIEEQLKVIG